MKLKPFQFLLLIWLLPACWGGDDLADAYGNFEAVEVLVSAEGSGNLIQFEVEEGDIIPAGQVLGFIDTTALYLQKEQFIASINALTSKTQNVQSQINVLLERKNNLNREQIRLQKLLSDDAATQKQLDDIEGEIEVVEKEMEATRSRLETNNRGILAEIRPMEVKIAQINDQIIKSIIYNPRKGTVLAKFAEEGEVVGFGKPLYKIADLESIILKVYISGSQLPGMKIGQTVEVKVDGDISFSGKVYWISEKAEFTPKIIQTKEERVNLVYAVKVRVENDGTLKIGMPGEVYFKMEQ